MAVPKGQGGFLENTSVLRVQGLVVPVVNDIMNIIKCLVYIKQLSVSPIYIVSQLQALTESISIQNVQTLHQTPHYGGELPAR